MIPDPLVELIDEHARRCYPEECVGVLLGKEGSATSIWPTANTHADSRSRRYRIMPSELLEAHMSARNCGEEIIGYYHSHPDASSRPSARDLSGALPGVSYLIVALSAGEVCERRSWRLRNEGSQFEEERLVRGTEHESSTELGRYPAL